MQTPRGDRSDPLGENVEQRSPEPVPSDVQAAPTLSTRELSETAEEFEARWWPAGTFETD